MSRPSCYRIYFSLHLQLTLLKLNTKHRIILIRVTDVINNALSFDNQGSWVGPYRETQQHPNHLNNNCSFCLADFLPDDRVILFPCCHGLHEVCFNRWNKTVCPVDKRLVRGIQTINFLGCSIILSERTQSFGTLVATFQRDIKPVLERLIHHLADHQPEIYENEQEHRQLKAFAHIVQIVFQDFLNLYDGSLPGHKIQEQVDTVLQHLSRDGITIESVAEKTNIDWDLKAFAKLVSDTPFNNIIDELVKLMEKHPIGLQQSISFGYLVNKLEQSGRTLFYHHLCRYIHSVLRKTTSAAFFTELSKEVDARFFKHHFEVVKGLTTDRERYAYLTKMDHASLARLDQLSQKRGPTFSQVKQTIAKITTSRERVRMLMLGVALLSTIICLGIVITRGKAPGWRL